jgi:hypothetical protein
MGSSVFDQLVKELDNQERRALLVRIQSSAPVYTQELAPPLEETVAFQPEEELAELSFLQRLFLLFKAFFTRKDRLTLLKEHYLKRLAAEIEHRNPELIDWPASRFKSGMYEELLALRSHARTLHGPLLEVLGQHRREFIAFLAREELKSFQDLLLGELEGETIWKHSSPDDEKEVRARLLRRFEELAAAIPETSKQRVSRDSRSLYSLFALSVLPFDGLLSPFSKTEDFGAPACDFDTLRKPLRELAAALEPVRVPPSAQALYDLFLFLHQERFEEPEFDLEEQLMADLSGFYGALRGIRTFHERVPLLAILRLLTGDPGFYPVPRSTAADWFSFYKDFWRQQVHRRYMDFVYNRRRSRLMEISLEFLEIPHLPALTNYRANKFGSGTPVKHDFSLAFVKGFLSGIFSRLYRALKLIYLNGEFYKEENRHDYTDAFLFLSELDNKIAGLESRLGPQGDLRAAVQEVKSQAAGARARRKRILQILSRADAEARSLIDATVEQLGSMKALLYGILKGQPGDRYDTLTNLNKLGGSENNVLRNLWSEALERADQAAALLGEIRDLEINQFETA